MLKRGIPVKQLLDALLSQLGIDKTHLQLDRIDYLFWSQLLEECKRLCSPDAQTNAGARAALCIIGAVTALEGFVNQKYADRFMTVQLINQRRKFRVPGQKITLEKKLEAIFSAMQLDDHKRRNYEFIKELIRVRGYWTHYPGLPVAASDPKDSSRLIENKQAARMKQFLSIEYAKRACDEVERFIKFVENK